MGKEYLIRCPWPPTELRPNYIRSNHWSKWRPKNTKYRDLCRGLALEQSLHMAAWPQKGDVQLEYTFCAPKGCRWDKDARESAFKAGQDGIAMAMGVDDSRFDVKKTHGDPVEGGCVLVHVKALAMNIPFEGVIR